MHICVVTGKLIITATANRCTNICVSPWDRSRFLGRAWLSKVSSHQEDRDEDQERGGGRRGQDGAKNKD